MMVRIIREPSRSQATLGVLFVDGVFHSFTLEDEIRERSGPVTDWKVRGETAIKAGRYRVALTPSQRFGRVLPEVLGVEGFTGIRIHAGNRRADTEGCILVGRARGDAQIFESRVALDGLLMAMLAAPKGSVELVIENPPGYAAAVAA
jgi:hypothetical protein